jgi:HEAT repeat-containing protein
LNENHSDDVKAKVLWLLGEMGLSYPVKVKKYVVDIAKFLNDDCSKLREHSVNAL